METIGKYQVERLLGRGGMGTVYEATDPVLHRKVAIKTMIPGLVDEGDLKERFLREAQAAGGLRHRNIVTVYDLGEDRGQPYIAMEFIDGTDLERIIQDKEPYSIEWKLDVIRQICEGLSYAHRSGIVHRDVKPANIRVTSEGEVKIMDFGIAHLQSSTMTKTGLVLGTVHYMAPEQVEGQRVDHRADIFSVGAIAYELVAYKKPFDGDSLTAVMFKIMRDRPDPLALPETGYSPGLEAIIMKALAKEITERYQTLSELHADLETLVRDTAPRLLLAARGLMPSPAEAAAVVGEYEREKAARVSSLVEEARRALAGGELDRAGDCARQALAIAPGDPAAKDVMHEAETEALRTRVEREMSDIRGEMDRARAEGHLQKALGLCRRLLELDPDDLVLAGTARDIEAEIQDREVEQLSSMALGYAADGDMELAQKITSKIFRMAPESPKYLELKAFLDEEAASITAEAFVATAREHLSLGNLDEARAAAEEALGVQPTHAVAREIRDRSASVLAQQEKAARPARAAVVDEPTPEPEPARPTVAPDVPFAAEAPPASYPEIDDEPHPLDELDRDATVALPSVQAAPAPPVEPPALRAPETGPVVPEPPPASAPHPEPMAAEPPPASAPHPEPVVPEPPPASAPHLEPLAAAPPPAVTPAVPVPAAANEAPALPAPAAPPASPEARRSEAAALMTSALNHFVQNNNAKAKKAAEKAIALDPENKKARELMKILGALS